MQAMVTHLYIHAPLRWFDHGDLAGQQLLLPGSQVLSQSEDHPQKAEEDGHAEDHAPHPQILLLHLRVHESKSSSYCTDGKDDPQGEGDQKPGTEAEPVL